MTEEIQMRDIPEGAPAPDFDLPMAGGGRISLASLKGRAVVLFFFPKADTPGCTTEARDFSELSDAFDAAGATVIGISRDSVRKLEGFRARQDLRVILASDEGGAATEAYGVWGEKTLYGRTYMGVERATFLVDADGNLRRVWRRVRVKGHAAEVLAAATAA